MAPIKLALHSFPLTAAMATLRLLSDCLCLHNRRASCRLANKSPGPRSGSGTCDAQSQGMYPYQAVEDQSAVNMAANEMGLGPIASRLQSPFIPIALYAVDILTPFFCPIPTQILPLSKLYIADAT